MDTLKNNWSLFLIGLATFVLGVIAIVTAAKLYQTGRSPIAPTVPKPAPAATTLCTLRFTIAASPSASLTTTLTPTPTTKSKASLSQKITATPTLRPTSTLTSTPWPTATPTSKPTVTPTPISANLPSAGSFVPTLAAILFGLVFLGIALLLAF